MSSVLVASSAVRRHCAASRSMPAPRHARSDEARDTRSCVELRMRRRERRRLAAGQTRSGVPRWQRSTDRLRRSHRVLPDCRRGPRLTAIVVAHRTARTSLRATSIALPSQRCGRESNSRIAVLQTAALPLGYRTNEPSSYSPAVASSRQHTLTANSLVGASLERLLNHPVEHRRVRRRA